MKKYIYPVVVVFMLAALLSCAAEVRADGECGKMCMYQKSDKMDMDEMLFRKFHMILENAKELGLSAQQIESIKDLKLKTKKDLIVKESEIDLAALDVKTELWKDAINLNAVNPLIDRKYDLKKEKAKILVAAMAGIKKTLSKDQMDKLKAMYDQKCEMCGRKRMMCHAMMKCPRCGMDPMSGSKGNAEGMEKN